jgi:ligand-binding sensor domain-containing protein
LKSFPLWNLKFIFLESIFEMSIKKKIIFALMFFLMMKTSFLFSQVAWTNYKTSNSLLPNNQVFCIAVDSLNRKWIGTDNGLAVFDGTTWTNYNSGNSGLTFTSVRGIAFDREGVAWIATVIGGLYSFDGTTWTNYNTGNSLIADDFVKGVAVDSADNIWCATGNGICRFNRVQWKTWNAFTSAVQSSSYNCVTPGKNNEIWAGANNGGIVRLRDTMLIANYTIANSFLQDNTIYCAKTDSLGQCWYGTPQHGAGVYNANINLWQTYDSQSSSINSPTVNALYVDSLQSKYFGTLAGLAIFHPNFTWTFYSYSVNGLPDNFVRAITKDKNGYVWIGTDTGGVAVLDENLSGVNETNYSQTFQLFPNPANANSEITVDHKFYSATFLLYDRSGRCVQQTVFSGNTIHLNAKLQSGIYVSEICDENGNVRKGKIIIF